MEIEINLKWLRIKTDTTWRQIAIFLSFLIFLFGVVAVLNGVNREVALAVVAALGVLIGAFVNKPREDRDMQRLNRNVRFVLDLLNMWMVGAAACTYSMSVYLISLM